MKVLPKQHNVIAFWINIVAFIIPFHWLAFLIAGLETKNVKWIGYSIFYGAPLFLIFIAAILDSSAVVAGFLFLGVFVSWIVAFIHSFFIIDDYKKLIIKKRNLKRSNSFDWLDNNKNDKKINTLSLSHKKILNEMLKEQSAINKKYKKINPIHQINFIDIIVMVEDFIDQTKELMKKEEKIEEIIKKINISEINKKIKNVLLQIKQTTNNLLIEEYKNSLKNLEKRKKTYKEFIDKKKIISLKLESYLEKIKEIKYDFLEVDFLISEEEKNNIFNKTDEIVEDINQQMNFLSDTYRDIEE